jgi:hypothetical protein
MGDRWAGAWGGRVNDSVYLWQPISFPSASSMSMSWYNNLHLDTEAGAVSGTVDGWLFVNKSTGMLLSVEGAANENSADVVQNPVASAGAFVWRLDYDGAGFFRLVNDGAGKVLDVPDESSEPGVPLHLWDGNGGDHQSWRVVDLGEGQYNIVNKNSGHYLGAPAGSTAGAAMEQQAQSGGDEQVWEIVVAG